MTKPKKVALAYSGGLEASVIIPWLKENYGSQVVAICGNLGQDGEELAGLEAQARASGAAEVYIEDMREEFVSQYLWKIVRAGAVYEHKYLPGASLARTLLAKKQVEIALATGCDALSHGCAGKGNDQVRFELTYKALAPHLPVIVPRREWNLLSREDAIEYAYAHKIPVALSPAKTYRRDRNIWHISHEGGALEDPANAPPDEIWMLTKSPKDAPDLPGEVAIAFEKGIPTAVDGQRMKAFELLETLNRLGATHGTGRSDLVENRFIGMKSRACYETAGGALITFAIRELEALTLDKSTLHFKQKLSLDYAELIYNGLWFTPLREALDAFFERTAEPVTGEIRLRLYKGNIDPISRKSPYSLHSPGPAGAATPWAYDSKDVPGFINLTGLPITVRAAVLAANRAAAEAGNSK